MSGSSNGGPASPSSGGNDAVQEDPAAASTSGGDSNGNPGSVPASSTAEAARVSPVDEDKPVEARFSNDSDYDAASRPEDGDIGISDANGGDAGDQPDSSVSRLQNKESKKVKKKVKASVDDYDSMLSEFDQFASKGANEAVGYGYEIGDMVWGKVKSHPWWPGHIYNEALASPSVQRIKREGHVLVAFFGDSSYGWYDPAELIPFAENFLEKSQQTASKPFLKAVAEAVDELSRRRALGLACRCRNKFNFWPSDVEDYFVVDVGDLEPVVYSLSQINKARENFHPNEMLSFVKQLALKPMASAQHQTIEFIKNKATALACRRALFEEFDETYAQAFGTVPVRPSKPTVPVAVNPSKAPLSGRLVSSETLGKKKSIKPTKTKDQVEKDKYIFKRRDESIQVKTKKTSTGPSYPLLVDGSGISETPMNISSASEINDGQHQSTNQTSMVSDIKPLEGSKKRVEGEAKKKKILKRNAGELGGENANMGMKKKKRKKEMVTQTPSGEFSSENVNVDVNVDVNVKKKKKKKKKEILNRASLDAENLHHANNKIGEAVERVSGMSLDIPLSAADNKVENQKNDGSVAMSSSLEAMLAIELGKKELPLLLEDLRSLAINPFHGVERKCQDTAVPLFLKYRSAVYQKSLVLFPPAENKKGEANSSRPPPSVEKTSDKSAMKLKRTLIRPDDPTKGGRKHGPPTRPDGIKKKRKPDDSEDTNPRKKLIKSEDMKDVKKKKAIDDSKSFPTEKKILQRPYEPQRGEAKEVRPKSFLSASSKAAKLESGQRMQRPVKVVDPTMLVMKFPPGASLPSGAQLRAKFARFGPLDHSATRVFWETYTCRLVYQYKADAEAALGFAVGSNNLFGNRNVRAYIREKAAEAEPVKPPKEAAVPPVLARIPVLSQQQQAQLKSCLKKATNEEAAGNGNGRGTRVKFVLGGEGAEQVSSYPEGGTSSSSSSYTHSSSTDVSTSKNLAKFGPDSIVTTPPQLQKPSPSSSSSSSVVNMGVVVGVEQIPKNDISQQLLNLLTRCRDVVNNLTGALGHVPYHPL